MPYLRVSLLAVLTLILTANSFAQCVIVRAVWGAGVGSRDVTPKVQSMVQSGVLAFKVHDVTLGVDPAVDTKKVLQSTCRDWRGRNSTRRYRDGDDVNIAVAPNDYYPGGGWNHPNPGYRDLRIMNAFYGHRDHIKDVTGQLNGMIAGGKLTLQVNNQTLGGDPAPNLTKTLTIYYLASGRHFQRKWPEGATVSLP